MNRYSKSCHSAYLFLLMYRISKFLYPPPSPRWGKLITSELITNSSFHIIFYGSKQYTHTHNSLIFGQFRGFIWALELNVALAMTETIQSYSSPHNFKLSQICFQFFPVILSFINWNLGFISISDIWSVWCIIINDRMIMSLKLVNSLSLYIYIYIYFNNVSIYDVLFWWLHSLLLDQNINWFLV